MTNKPFKDKTGKLRFDLIPPEFDKAFAEVATLGIEKLKASGVENPERNWEQGLKLVGDHLAAVKRHINKWELGEDLNKEKGMEDKALNHLKHALWHIGAMVTQIDRGRQDLDDRACVRINGCFVTVPAYGTYTQQFTYPETDRYGHPIVWRKQDTKTEMIKENVEMPRGWYRDTKGTLFYNGNKVMECDIDKNSQITQAPAYPVTGSNESLSENESTDKFSAFGGCSSLYDKPRKI